MVLAVCPERKRISLVFGYSERRGECYPVLLFGKNGSKDIINYCRRSALGNYRASRLGQLEASGQCAVIGEGDLTL